VEGRQEYRVTMSRQVRQSPERVFQVVEDIERFPEFMPNVNRLVVEKVEGNRKIAAWDTTVDDAPLQWVEEGIYDRENLVVRFRALEGVFDRFDGYWQVVPEGDGSRVTFELVYEIGLPEIEHVVGPILRERLIENAEKMLAAMERRVEEGS
jgi:coenzyme Q-binding protein COQ10